MTKASFDTVLNLIATLILGFLCVIFFKEKEWVYFVISLLFAIFTTWRCFSAYSELPDK